MGKLNRFLITCSAGFAMLASSAVGSSADLVQKKDLKPERLAVLEEQAQSASDHKRLAELYRMRAEMLDEKVERHERLEQRYAAAPKSLLAKRGHAWNTPERQRQLARKARRQALEARRSAELYVAMAESPTAAED